MANYVKVFQKKVVRCIVASPSFFDTFIDDTPGEWIEVVGKVGNGWNYDKLSENFYPPQPYPSWTLNESLQWVPPVPKPDNGIDNDWDEENQQWGSIS